MKHLRTRFTDFFLVLFVLGSSPCSRAQTVTIAQPFTGLEGFELTPDGLYSWRAGFPGQGGEFPVPPWDGVIIHNMQRPDRPSGPGSDPVVFMQSTAMASRQQQVMLQDSYFYHFRPTGGGWRLFRHSLVNQTLPVTEEVGQNDFTSVGTVMDGGFYAAWSGVTGGVAKLYVRSETQPNYNSTTNLPMGMAKKLLPVAQVNTDGTPGPAVIAMLTTGGGLYVANLSPGTLGFSQLASGVTDVAVRQEQRLIPSGGSFVTRHRTVLYASAGLPASSLPGRVLTYNLTDSVSASSTVTADATQQLSAIAVDDARIWVTRTPVNPGGGIIPPTFNYAASVILRKTLAAGLNGSLHGGNPYEAIVAGEEGRNLRSDGQYVYWLSGGQVRRREAGGMLDAVDCAAVGMEAVQAVQNLENTVPLVAGRAVMVRGYASYPQNNTGKNFRLTARLTGYLNGNALGEIPAPNSPVVDGVQDTATMRGTMLRSFNFEMPASWLSGPGALFLVFTVNPSSSVPETPANATVNNTISRLLTVTAARRPCLIFKQVRGTMPDYDPFAGGVNGAPSEGFDRIVRRAASLLPVTDFDVRFNPGVLQRMVATSSGTAPTAYDFNTEEGWWLAHSKLSAVAASSTDPVPDTHWVGMISPDEPAIKAGGGKSRRLLTLMDAWQRRNPAFAWSSILHGHTLAHELGHCYGRGHVNQDAFADCDGGTPRGPYDVPPGDPCVLSAAWPAPGSVAGYDPLSPPGLDGTDCIIAPGAAGDLMSYRTDRWVAPFTWNAVLDLMPAPPPAARHPRNGQGGTPHPAVLRLTGVLDAALTRAPSFQVQSFPSSSMDGTKVQQSLEASAALGISAPLQALISTGEPPVVVAQHAVAEEEIADGTDPVRIFLQDVPLPPAGEVTRVQLRRDGIVLTEIRPSAQAPVVQFSNVPAVNAAAGVLLCDWSASDADGDALRCTLQYSCNDGDNWLTIEESVTTLSAAISTRLLAGGPQCRLRVMVTDGFHTGMAVSAAFALSDHAPIVTMNGLRPHEPVLWGSPLRLTGFAYDAEDGTLAPDQLTWTLTGPVVQEVTGGTAVFSFLPPGAYTLALTGTDSAATTGSDTRAFTVLSPAIPDAATIPVLDGYNADAAYDAAPVFPLDPATAEPAVRLVHAGGSLYICASGLSASSQPLAPRRLRIYLNPDGSADSTPQSGDVLVVMDQNGVVTLSRGDGTQWVLADSAEAATVRPSLNRPSAGIWNAELCLPEALLGGWDHRMSFALGMETAPGNVQPWPPGISLADPATWAPVDLGAPQPQPDQPPSAAASAPALVSASDNVTLDGSQSADPEGSPLAFAWTQLSGPAVVLTSEVSPQPAFTAPDVSDPAAVSFQLVVHDGTSASTPVTVQCAIVPPATVLPPVPAGVRVFDAVTGHITADIFWEGSPGDRVAVQTSTDLEQWEDIVQTTVGDSLLVRIEHQPSLPATRRYYRLHAVNAEAVQNAGTALRFDGTSSFVSVPHDPAFNAFPMTCSAWVLTTTDDSVERAIVEKYIDSSFNGWTMFVRNGELRAWYFRDGANYIWNPDGDRAGLQGGFVADGFWHHCTLTVDEAGGHLYVDGAFRGHMPWVGTPGPATTTTPLQIGRYNQAPSFTGDIDDVVFRNIALNEAEDMTATLVSPNPGAPGVQSIWRFDEAAGGIAGSSTNAAYNGELTGGAQWVPSSAPVWRQ